MGNTVQDFYVDGFSDSYGDPQPVEASVKRSLGAVRCRYRINGGTVRTAPTARVRRAASATTTTRASSSTASAAWSRGTKPGDEVEVWFDRPAASRSPQFTYTARVRRRGAKVLIMSAENYTGRRAGPGPERARTTSRTTRTRSTAAASSYDIYDVDASDTRRRTSLGVLSHYDAVIWYTGDDYLTRRPGQPGGTGTARFDLEEMIDARDYLNEGGKLFYTGKNAGRQSVRRGQRGPQLRVRRAARGRQVVLVGDDSRVRPGRPAAADGCIPHNDDFLQYYLGAYCTGGAGQSFDDAAGDRRARWPASGPFGGLELDVRRDRRRQPGHTRRRSWSRARSCDPAALPAVRLLAQRRQLAAPGRGAVHPFSGTQYMAAGADSRGLQAAAPRRSPCPADATAPQLTFKFSADLEEDWDFIVVEARTPGAGTTGRRSPTRTRTATGRTPCSRRTAG